MKTLGDYLKEHMPTNKQLNIIQNIEQYAPKNFTGITKQDAFLYIQKYIDYYYVFNPKNNFTSYIEPKVERDLTPIYGELDPYEYELDPYGDGWGGAVITERNEKHIFMGGGLDCDDGWGGW